MGASRPRAGTVALDSGALIALERADERIRALCRAALRAGTRLLVPAPVLAQVWREGRRQATLAVDACLVLVARRGNAVVVTSDADDLLRLDPGLPLERS